MKQEIIKEFDLFYNNDGSLNNEESITIEEAIIETKPKQSKEVIKQLKYIKKRRKEQFYNPIDYPYKSIEITIAGLVNKRHRASKREKQILEICKLLRGLQKKYNYTELSRSYINKILIEYSSLKNNAKNRILKLILKQAKSKRSRIIEKKYLINSYHLEKKLGREMTKSKNSPIEKIWGYRTQEIEFFSFI